MNRHRVVLFAFVVWSLCSCGFGSVEGDAPGRELRSVEQSLVRAATYNSALGVPLCLGVGSSCDTGSLIVGRAGLGPELNAPNTNKLGVACVDGTGGTFHIDESVDRIRVFTNDGSVLAAGKAITIEIDVWAPAAFTADRLDLFYTTNALAPSWSYVKTLLPSKAGVNTLRALFVVPAKGTVHSVRASFRSGGVASQCPGGARNDRDDIAFVVIQGSGTQGDAGTVGDAGISGSADGGSTSPADAGTLMPEDGGVTVPSHDAGPAIDDGGVDGAVPADGGDALAQHDAGLLVDAGVDTLPYNTPRSSVASVVDPLGPHYSVDPNAPPDGDGGALHPWRALSVALIAAQKTGGVIELADGVHQGPIVLLNQQKPLRIRPAHADAGVRLECATPISGWSAADGGVFTALSSAPSLSQLFVDGVVLPRSRHPATGYSQVGADGPLLPKATPNVELPLTATDAAFLKGRDLSHATVTLRVIDYWWNTAVVDSVDFTSNVLRVAQTPSTARAADCSPQCWFTYRALSGWGYYLENERWMLDAAPGWAMDTSTGVLSVKLPDGSDPSSHSILASSSDDCVSLQSSPDVTIDSLEISHATRGVRVASSPRVRLNRVVISDSARQAVWVSSSDALTVDDSLIARTGAEAISVVNIGTGGSHRLESNVFTDIGTLHGARFLRAAIHFDPAKSDSNVVIKHNVLQRTAYVGIIGTAGALIEGNTIEDFCLISDDCGGIHISGYGPRITARGNVIRRATANLLGKNRHAYPVAGIYLDDFAEGMTIEHNTVVDTDIALMLHNAYDNDIRENVFVGGKQTTLKVQEDQSRHRYDATSGQFQPVVPAVPAMSDNRVTRNQFIARDLQPLFDFSSSVGDTKARAPFMFQGDHNTLAPFGDDTVIVLRGTPSIRGFKPRFVALGLDPTATFVTSEALALDSVTDSKPAVLSNTVSLNQYSSYSSTAQQTKTVVNCSAPNGASTCLDFAAAPSATSLLISPSFPIEAQQTYEVRVAIQNTGADFIDVALHLRRNGPTYESLDGTGRVGRAEIAPGEWLSAPFYFSGAVTLANARVDLELQGGAHIVATAVVVTPVTLVQSDMSDHVRIEVNPDFIHDSSAMCLSSLCSGWSNVAGATVNWPLPVSPRSASVVWRP